MKLLADENVDESIVEWLSTLNIDLKSIRRTMPGATDPQVIAIAETDGRIILTNDLDFDFGELVFHRGLATAGIILLRIQPPFPAFRLQVLQRHWKEIEIAALGKFIVVTQNKLRLPPLVATP